MLKQFVVIWDVILLDILPKGLLLSGNFTQVFRSLDGNNVNWTQNNEEIGSKENVIYRVKCHNHKHREILERHKINLYPYNSRRLF